MLGSRRKCGGWLNCIPVILLEPFKSLHPHSGSGLVCKGAAIAAATTVEPARSSYASVLVRNIDPRLSKCHTQIRCFPSGGVEWIVLSAIFGRTFPVGNM
jgi:hypothetical protein